MTHQALALKWRPQNFEEIVGQEHIATTLKNALLQDRIANAYLFCGMRGVGKTSTARILAKALNCEKGPTPAPCNTCNACLEITSGKSIDVLEIDGASNRGIDEIRQLRENVKLSPSRGAYRVYIIDEIHMLTTEAFNALLKTLEEPPRHVKFIFATTNPDKVLPTILSRCQRFDFNRIPAKTIADHLITIAQKEKLSLEEKAAYVIARAADGSLRDAQMLLDQMTVFSEGEINADSVAELLGVISDEHIIVLIDALAQKNTSQVLTVVKDLVASGKNLMVCAETLLEYTRHMLVALQCAGSGDLIELPQETTDILIEKAQAFSSDELLYMFKLISQALIIMRRSHAPRFELEAVLVKIAGRQALLSVPEIVAKLDALQAGGVSSKPSLHAPQKPLSPPPAAKNASSAVSKTTPATSALKKGLTSPKALFTKKVATATTVEEEISDDEHTVEPFTGTVDDLAWTDFIDQVRDVKISLASYLAEGQVMEIHNSTVVLGFQKQHNFHREILGRVENKRFLEKMLREHSGKRVRLELMTLPEADPGDKAVDQKGVAPVVESAMKVFGGRLIR